MVTDWVGRRVLVTGAGGFIGSHLAEQLVRDGATLRAFVRYTSRGDHGNLEELPADVRSEIDVFVGDLVDPEAVASALTNIETVFHLGALIPIPYSYVHPREYVAANVEGTLNVLEAVRRSGREVRIVHTSTSEVYGTAQSVPISERHPLRAQSPYAATKIAADQLALSFHRSFELPVVVVRPFNTYGPRQSLRAIIPTVVAQALTRDRIELGSLSPTRDLLYVRDTVLGMIAAGAAPGLAGIEVNLGSGTEVSVGELVERVLGILGRHVPVVSIPARTRPAASEVERLVADTERAREQLRWAPTVDLDTGLRDVIAWVERTLPRLKPDVYNV